MKRKILLLLVLNIVNQFYVHASSGGQPTFSEKDEATIQTRAPIGMPTNSSGMAISGINYDKTAFIARSTMFLPFIYLGAASDFSGDAQPFALARAYVDSNKKVHVDALADKARVNGVDDQTPLLGKTITDLSLMSGDMRFGSVPVLTLNAPEKVYLVTNPEPGMVRMLTNTPGTIADAAGTVITNDNVVAVAASSKYIFAAVPQAGSLFGDAGADDRGIAVLTPDNNKLKVLDATNFAGTTPAAQQLDVTANVGPIAFVDAGEVSPIANALLGNSVDMHYDSVLGRLYIGLSDVRRDDIITPNQGGVLGIAVGRVGTNSLVLNSVISGVSKTLFNVNMIDDIVGLYFTDGTDARVTITKPRVMHTSTGKHYLIVHSTIQTTDGVFALPLIGNDTGVAADLVGTIAAVDTDGVSKCDNMAPTTAAELISATQTPARVDAPLPACSPSIGSLTDIYVEGDSVFLSYAGTAQSASAGIYRTTALFNADGAIRAWAPLTRVSGDVRRSQGVGLDPETGNLYSVTPATLDGIDTNYNTVRITQWGKSNDVAFVGDDTTMPNNLTSLLNQIFPKETCRVHQLCAFDEFTPGFAECQFSIMVALGKDTVALIQTGMFDGSNFIPVQNFEINTNVFVFKDDVLKEIGPLSCCQVSRSANSGEGWLYVGGYRGVAVLSDDNGNGYTSLDNLTSGGYPGNGYSFKKLTPSNNPESVFWNVRSLQIDSDNLVLVTQKDLFYIPQDAAKFTAAAPSDLDEIHVPLPNDFARECIADVIVVPDMLILGMTHGLFTFDGLNIHEVTVDGKSLGPIIQLQYLSQTKGTYSSRGNLYVLAGDITTGMAKIYRFDVDELPTNLPDRLLPIKVAGIQSAFINFGEFRGNFITDGADLFHSLSKHLLQTRFLEVYPIARSGSKFAITPFLDIDGSCEFTAGAMIQEPAFGAWIFPGDWGVRVNL